LLQFVFVLLLFVIDVTLFMFSLFCSFNLSSRYVKYFIFILHVIICLVQLHFWENSFLQNLHCLLWISTSIGIPICTSKCLTTHCLSLQPDSCLLKLSNLLNSWQQYSHFNEVSWGKNEVSWGKNELSWGKNELSWGTFSHGLFLLRCLCNCQFVLNSLQHFWQQNIYTIINIIFLYL